MEMRQKADNKDRSIAYTRGEDWYQCRLCGCDYEYWSMHFNDGYCPHCNGTGHMKPDKGHELTDALLADIEKKISREYAQAGKMEGRNADL